MSKMKMKRQLLTKCFTSFHGNTVFRLLLYFLSAFSLILIIVFMKEPELFENKTFVLNSCTPVLNIAFMKIHKTGSTSVQNLLFRYGDTHNLTIAVPKSGGYFGHPVFFSKQMVPKLRQSESESKIYYNIIANHMRFNYKEIKSLMALNAKLITIIREPNDLFQSLYSYYDLSQLYSGLSFDKFLTHLYTNTTIGRQLNLDSRLHTRYGRNQMSFDLGLNVSQFSDETQINEFVKRLDSCFDLVLINELMDESLVLLKHELCLSTSDVIVFKLNARKANQSLNESKNVFNMNKTKLLHLNSADHKLYAYFKQRFVKLIQKFGFENMRSEVKALNEETNRLYDECVDTKVFLSDLLPKSVYYSPNVIRLKPKANSRHICEQLTAIEGFYIDLIRQKQNHLYDRDFRSHDEIRSEKKRIQILRNSLKL